MQTQTVNAYIANANQH